MSAVAFTGHKPLMGATGTGGLVFTRDLDIRTTRFGGTGVESPSLVHTQSYPYRLEVGTLNLLGIIGLGVGLEYVEKVGIDVTRAREVALAQRLAEGLLQIPAVRIHGPARWNDWLRILMTSVRNTEPDCNAHSSHIRI